MIGLYVMYREAQGLGYPRMWFERVLRAFQPGFGELAFHIGRRLFLRWLRTQTDA